jgi:transposase
VIQVTPQMRILVAVDPIDFRKGTDGIAGVCREVLQCDPFTGWVFVFHNRRRTAIRILSYDGQGFWLSQKRLSKGRFHWWPSASGQKAVLMDVHELLVLLWNGDPTGARVAPMWKKLTA